ncbi:hypothetical protein [Pseudarthrobacter albicanus]|uniref:hypothetical protein n=1 Tax=Pseudarthrobacter albicanus TaxID=2823873 RepID=UPI001BA4410C|nr:hypothetical protein [Pseudarthrobacter albicanus]
MGAEAKDPEEIVKDGVEGRARAVPREEEAGRASGTPPSDPDAGQDARASGDTRKVPGPAGEQDEETGDDRGLTTDASPD